MILRYRAHMCKILEKMCEELAEQVEMFMLI